MTRISTRTATPNAELGSLRLAAIDIGSNSIHMIVAQIDPDGSVTTLWRMKEPVGLGRISFPSHQLTQEAIDRAMLALAHFKHVATQRQAEKILCVATSAVREAYNGGDLIQRASQDLKLRVKVATGQEEARLIYLGVRHARDLGETPSCIIDVGGGSVEFAVGDKTGAALLESRKLGAARMTSHFVKSDPLSSEDHAALLQHFDMELKALTAKILALQPARFIGTSGTFENVAAMCDAMEQDGPVTPSGRIARKTFEKLLKKLLKSTSAQRARIAGLDDQRKDQVVAAAILIGQLFERLKIDTLEVCQSALREGIVYDYLARHRPELEVRREVPDPRRRSVLDLARRCDWHERHSTHVAMLTLRLFDELRDLHGLGNIERGVIEFAALLHDIGWHISRDGHHKHSMYLIQHGQLEAFSKEEVGTMACIARYHRKATPDASHESYAALPKHARKIVDVGAALLRVADGLDRSHGQIVTDLQCEVTSKLITCTLQTRGDAELETWGAKRKAEWFEKVLGRPIEFKTA